MNRPRYVVFAVLAAVGGLADSAVSQQTARYDGPIIDMHMHANPVFRDAAGEPLSRPCNPRPCQGPPAQARSDEEVLSFTLAAMDRHNIVLGFLSQWPLDRVYRWVDAAPGRFIASPFISDPAMVSLEDLRVEYEAGRLAGLGELALPYSGVLPADPSLEPFFALAEELDLPVLVHHQGTAGPSEHFRISNGHPEQLEEVLVRHPTLRLYMENSGYPFLGETIALMYRYPKVYGDLSTGTWIYPRETFHQYLKGLINAGLGKRLMFGSDQMQWPEVIDDAVEAIESATFLTDEEKQDIFYNNAARFLNLSDGRIAEHHAR
ncbi:MAG: amidohydrolase [bacterium]|nr:amidohydrolase [bacterium]